MNALLMLLAARHLGLHVIYEKDKEKKQYALSTLLLIIPWILVSIFFGFGPPPETAAAWTASAAEQQIRYSILVAAGISAALGFAALREKLKQAEGSFFAMIGFTAVIIAIPLFISNMIFWGFFLTESFKLSVAAGLEKMPEWFAPARKLFGLISVVEVALTYLATALFAQALYVSGWFSKTSAGIYIIISLSAFIIVILSACCPEPFVTAGFAVSIPAIPFIMPYFMGINLLMRLRK